MIEVKELVRNFGPTLAVDNVSFTVQPGEVVGFLGPNGAGKTTTIRILTAYLPPTSGEARVAGLDVREDSLAVRRLVGYLPENNPQYDDLEVAEYLEWIAEVRGMPLAGRTRRIREVISRCGLGEALGKPIGQLSKGFRQRVGLAQAIIHDPPILFLDEPTSGLDPNQTRDVRELIRELKKEKTVFISTHILPEVQAVCDRVLIIHRGKVVAQGTPRELSSAAVSANRIRLTLKSERLAPQEALSEIRKIRGVESADLKHSDTEITLEILPEQGQDLREELFRFVIDKRWTLLEMVRESATLEEVFRQLTL